MLNVIKEQLLKIIENIDAGNSNISEKDAINTISRNILTKEEIIKK